MTVSITARHDETGRWTVERDGIRVDQAGAIPDDELPGVIAGLIADGHLQESARIRVLGDDGPVLRRADEFLGSDAGEDVDRTLAQVRAERFANDEHYY